MATYKSSVNAVQGLLRGLSFMERESFNLEFPQAGGDALLEYVRVCGINQLEADCKELVRASVWSSSTPVDTGTYLLQIKRASDNTVLLAAGGAGGAYNLEGLTGNSNNQMTLAGGGVCELDEGDHVIVSVTSSAQLTAGDALFVTLEFEDLSTP